MIGLTVIPDATTTLLPGFTAGDDPLMAGEVTALGGIPDGTSSGAAAVLVVITLADGSTVAGQTTLALLHGAAAALVAKHGLPA